VRINPYGTDLVQPHLLFLFWPYSSSFFKEKGAFNGPYRPYGRRTAAAKSGHVFQQSVQSVRYCLSTDFEVGCVGFLPVYFKHGNRGRDK
jgi:hypothetical protein